MLVRRLRLVSKALCQDKPTSLEAKASCAKAHLPQCLQYTVVSQQAHSMLIY